MRGHALLVAGFVPGTSRLHHAPLWSKALGLAGTALLCFGSPVLGTRTAVAVTTAVLGAVVLCHVAVRLPLSRLWRPVRAMAVFLVLIGGYQWWQHGPGTGWQAVAAILATVLASNLLTATTPVDALLDGLGALVEPLRRFGADPERFALTVGLMLRSIPFVIGAFADVRDAARARGLERNVRARSLPVIMTTVAYARATGDALAARGLGEADEGDAGAPNGGRTGSPL